MAENLMGKPDRKDLVSVNPTAMNEDLISVIDIANAHGKHKQSIFKILRRLGIAPELIRSS